MQAPEQEPLPPEVLAEVARMEQLQADALKQQDSYMSNTTRNQRRVKAKLRIKRIKKHMKGIK